MIQKRITDRPVLPPPTDGNAVLGTWETLRRGKNDGIMAYGNMNALETCLAQIAESVIVGIDHVRSVANLSDGSCSIPVTLGSTAGCKKDNRFKMYKGGATDNSLEATESRTSRVLREIPMITLRRT